MRKLILKAMAAGVLCASLAHADPLPPTRELLLRVSEAGNNGATRIVRGRIDVDTDFLKPIRLTRPVGNLVIGNPFIADVIPRDDTYMFVSGKSAGHTNLLVYDRAGHLVGEYMIYVRSSEQYVSMMKGPKGRSHFECMPRCERVLRIEDSPDETGELAGRITTVRGLITGEAEKAKAGDAAAGGAAQLQAK